MPEPEMNQRLYTVAYEGLTKDGLPEHLADAAARIVASDDCSERLPIDNEICHEVVKAVAEARNWHIKKEE